MPAHLIGSPLLIQFRNPQRLSSPSECVVVHGSSIPPSRHWRHCRSTATHLARLLTICGSCAVVGSSCSRTCADELRSPSLQHKMGSCAGLRLLYSEHERNKERTKAMRVDKNLARVLHCEGAIGCEINNSLQRAQGDDGVLTTACCCCDGEEEEERTSGRATTGSDVLCCVCDNLSSRACLLTCWRVWSWVVVACCSLVGLDSCSRSSQLPAVFLRYLCRFSCLFAGLFVPFLDLV